jgi:hypothetical protein
MPHFVAYLPSTSALAICRKSRIAPGDIGVYEGQLGKKKPIRNGMFVVSMDPTLQRKASFMEACNQVFNHLWLPPDC